MWGRKVKVYFMFIGQSLANLSSLRCLRPRRHLAIEEANISSFAQAAEV
jgi:hypothetical protein